MLDEGVALLGGCCGTGPAHTAAIATAIAAATSGPRSATVTRSPSTNAHRRAGLVRRAGRAADRAPGEARRRTVRRAGGDGAARARSTPPSSSPRRETLADAGADAIDVADSPDGEDADERLGRLPADPGEASASSTVLHFPTRGRNLLRLQGDLLGAHALGIRNLFVCLGDPVTIGDYPQGRQRGRDRDRPAGARHRGVQPGADRAGIVDRRAPTVVLRRRRRRPERARPGARGAACSRSKVDAGARFLLSQPVYTADPIRACARRTSESPASRSWSRSSPVCCPCHRPGTRSSSTTRFPGS